MLKEVNEEDNEAAGLTFSGSECGTFLLFSYIHTEGCGRTPIFTGMHTRIVGFSACYCATYMSHLPCSLKPK